MGKKSIGVKGRGGGKISEKAQRDERRGASALGGAVPRFPLIHWCKAGRQGRDKAFQEQFQPRKTPFSLNFWDSPQAEDPYRA